MEFKLSRKVQQQNHPLLFKIAWFNGLGAHFSMGTVIYLFALHYGAGDMTMAALYGALHITSLTSALVPSFLNGMDTSRIWSLFWKIRSIFLLGYFAIPFISNQNLQILIIIFIYYSFSISRAFGHTAYLPILRALSSKGDLPYLISNIFKIITLTSIAVLLISYIALKLPIFNSLDYAYYFLIGLGFIFNSTATYYIRKLPLTGTLQRQEGLGIGKTAIRMLKSNNYRHIFYFTILQTSLLICTPYITNFLKNEVAFHDSSIFFMTLIGLIGSFLSTQFIQITGKRISSRSMMFFTHLLLVISGLCWCFMPATWAKGNYELCAIVYIITMLGVTGSFTILNQLQANRLPEGSLLQGNICYQITTALSALLTFGLVYLNTEIFTIIEVNEYSTLFSFWIILSALVCILTLNMKSCKGRQVVEELFILTPSNLFKMYQAFRIERDKDKELSHVVEGLIAGKNQVSRDLLLEYLKSNDFRKRYFAFKTLNNYPTPEAYPYIMDEINCKTSALRQEAITSIGILKKKEAIPDLLVLLEDDSSEIRANAVKSLLRLGKELEPDTILKLYHRCVTSRHKLEIILGLVTVKHKDLLYQILKLELLQKPEQNWASSLFIYIASIHDKRESMTEVFDYEKYHQTGLDTLLDHFEYFHLEGLSRENIEKYFELNLYEDLNQNLSKHMSTPWLLAFDRISAFGILFLWNIEKETYKSEVEEHSNVYISK